MVTDLSDMVLMDGINNKLEIIQTKPVFNIGDKLITLDEAIRLEESCDDPATLSIIVERVVKPAKAAIIKSTGTSFSQTRSVKKFLEPMVKEWCEITGRMDSALLNWSKAVTEEDELNLFDDSIQTAKQVLLFCQDLTGFMTSVMENCPVKHEEFLRMKAAKG